MQFLAISIVIDEAPFNLWIFHELTKMLGLISSYKFLTFSWEILGPTDDSLQRVY